MTLREAWAEYRLSMISGFLFGVVGSMSGLGWKLWLPLNVVIAIAIVEWQWRRK